MPQSAYYSESDDDAERDGRMRQEERQGVPQGTRGESVKRNGIMHVIFRLAYAS